MLDCKSDKHAIKVEREEADKSDINSQESYRQRQGKDSDQEEDCKLSAANNFSKANIFKTCRQEVYNNRKHFCADAKVFHHRRNFLQQLRQRSKTAESVSSTSATTFSLGENF